jgi:hypothetical protein
MGRRWRPLKSLPAELARIKAGLAAGVEIEVWWQML